MSFTKDYGDLPNLQIIPALGSNVTATVTETQKGTREYIECSGKGVCIFTTGLCSCRTGWSSSDGMGGQGGISDCGYRMPFVPVAN